MPVTIIKIKVKIIMKKILKTLLIFSSLLVSYNTFAYGTSSGTEQCKKPRFNRFSLPTYKAPERINVAPESEFSFTI